LKDAIEAAKAAYEVELMVVQVRINVAINVALSSGRPYPKVAEFIQSAVDDLRPFAQRLVEAQRAYRDRPQ
jgi:hypothetical protein